MWAILLPGIMRAEEVPWRSSEYSQFAGSSTSVSLFLENFAQDQGIPLVMSENITGEVTGRFGPVHPEAFLDQITRQLGLVWFYDGSALYVYRTDELQSQVLLVPGAQMAELTQTLSDFGLLTERYPIRTLPERGLMYVTGPPRYMELVTQISNQIGQSSTQQARIEVVMEVFPLKYAWADNQAFRIGSSEVIVPGVATILNNLVNGQQAGGLNGRVVSAVPLSLPGLRGSGLSSVENAGIAMAAQSARAAEIAAAQADARANAVSELSLASQEEDAQIAAMAAQIPTVIQAEPRLNAIIIRDVRERIPTYKEIIERLDVPVGLVQIEAYILDVDTSSGFDWGPPYQAQWQRGGQARAAGLTIDGLASPNLTISLMRGEVIDFLAKMKALESEGHARMVSRPTVLTINNVEAILTNEEEFFVKVGGGVGTETQTQAVDLFNVNVGTKLRILPHIVEEDGARRIKLITTIEDGRRLQEQVDDVPIVARNTIDTQAVLNEGNSLLIGGLFREEVVRNEQRIPLVGSIPKVGKLFTTIDYDNRKFERMVLITPTIVDLGDPSATACPPELHLPYPAAPTQGQPLEIQQPLSLPESQLIIPTSAEIEAGSEANRKFGFFSFGQGRSERRSTK